MDFLIKTIKIYAVVLKEEGAFTSTGSHRMEQSYMGWRNYKIDSYLGSHKFQLFKEFKPCCADLNPIQSYGVEFCFRLFTTLSIIFIALE